MSLCLYPGHGTRNYVMTMYEQGTIYIFVSNASWSWHQINYECVLAIAHDLCNTNMTASRPLHCILVVMPTLCFLDRVQVMVDRLHSLNNTLLRDTGT